MRLSVLAACAVPAALALALAGPAAPAFAGPALAGPVSASPAGGAQPIPLAGSGDAALVEVRGGCGFGEHRGPFGGCRINHGPRGRIRAFETGLPRGCPPGLHRGYYGRCV